MKKIICIFLIFILSLNYYSNVFSSSSWEALDNFTKKQYELLFESNLSNISWEYWDIFDISKKKDTFNNIADSIKKSRESVENDNEIILSKITNLEESKKEIEEDIKNVLKKIQDLRLASAQLKTDIELNEKKIELLKQKIEENKIENEKNGENILRSKIRV